MTREEAIKVLRTESIELGGAAPSVCRFLEALDMAVKALVDVTDKDVGEWIRVEDRLPLELDPAPYAFCLEALCEMSYLVGGIPGTNTVRHFGLEEGADNEP